MDDGLALDVYYEKCRVLLSAVANPSISANDREVFVWILEEYFDKLGEVIEKIPRQ